MAVQRKISQDTENEVKRTEVQIIGDQHGSNQKRFRCQAPPESSAHVFMEAAILCVFAHQV